MTRTYEESDRLLGRALAITPGGSQTGSKAPGRAGPLGGYPMFLERGRGAIVYDVDGNEYLDFIGGLAAVAIGHAQPEVIEACRHAMLDGNCMSLPTRDEVDAAEALCAATGFEQVRFVKTGSESTEAAVRIARKATGRYKIMTVASGYSSWHSWFQAVKPWHPGVPSDYEDMITGIPYGWAPELLAQELAGDEYACVILEPAPITGGGNAEWLGELTRVARKAGVVVIFDEVVWGFRHAVKGMGQSLGVTPDLATFGKALGNGVPIGAVLGRADLMQHADVISSTFGGDRLGLAAAWAVMTFHVEHDVCDRLAMLGQRFQDGINQSQRLRCTGYPSHPIVTLEPHLLEAGGGNVSMSLLLQGLADRGVLWHPAGGNVMDAMSMSAIDSAVTAFHEAANDVAAARVSLRGQPYSQAFARAR